MTKQIKGNAATVAAGKKAAVRPEVKSFIADIQHAQQSLNAKLYEAAMWCRDNNATSEELDDLIAVIDRRKRADFKRIVTAPSEAVTKSMPANLVQAAQFIRAKVKGAPTATAKSYATGKLDSAGLKAKLEGKEPAKKASEPAPVQDDEPAGKRDVQLPAPSADEVGFFMKLNDLLPQGEKEVKEYGPECRKAFKAWKEMTEKLIAAAANG